MFQTEWNTETFLRVQREEGFAIGLEQGIAIGLEQGLEEGITTRMKQRIEAGHLQGFTDDLVKDFAKALAKKIVKDMGVSQEQGAHGAAEAYHLVKSGKVSSVEELLARGFNQCVAEIVISVAQMP